MDDAFREVTRKLELRPDVERVFAQIGTASAGSAALLGSAGTDVTNGTVTLQKTDGAKPNTENTGVKMPMLSTSPNGNDAQKKYTVR